MTPEQEAVLIEAATEFTENQNNYRDWDRSGDPCEYCFQFSEEDHSTDCLIGRVLVVLQDIR